MLLLAATVDFLDDDIEAGNSAAMSSQSTVALTVGPEWRRYSLQSAKMALYFGLQPVFSYDKISTKGVTGSSGIAIEDKRSTTSYGANLTFGAEDELLKNLSVSVHLRPLNYTYSKREFDNSDSTQKIQRFTFAQNAALFVRLYF